MADDALKKFGYEFISESPAYLDFVISYIDIYIWYKFIGDLVNCILVNFSRWSTGLMRRT